MNRSAVAPATLFLAVAMLVIALTPVPPVGEVAAQGDDLEEVRWTAAESPIVVTTSMEIGPDVHLVIEAGVEVRFDQKVGLQVKGALSVEGTEGMPVRFVPNVTGETVPNYWADVRLTPERPGLGSNLTWAVFSGADTGLLVGSTDTVIEHCTFTKNRYGILARGTASIDVRDCDFINNSVLGLEWETGADGSAERCLFEENVVGVYCYENVTPLVRDCEFRANYHHLSFARGGNATISDCDLHNSSVELLECYWNSSPLFQNVEFTDPEHTTLFLRNGSRPRFVGGTPLSKLDVVSLDNLSYAVALMSITILVLDDSGTPLEGANVSLYGSSGDVLAEGVTGGNGRMSPAHMSTYTMDGKNNTDAENPHRAVVDWRGHNATFTVTPRDLTKENVLTLEVDLSPPEPSTSGWYLNILLILVIGLALMALLSRRSRGRVMGRDD